MSSLRQLGINLALMAGFDDKDANFEESNAKNAGPLDASCKMEKLNDSHCLH